jgi:RimJ/RimL family protein N-acetyltransferase
MDPLVISRIRLREIAEDDLPRIYEFNLDPDANRLAATLPRSAERFEAHWTSVLADSNVVARAIVVEDRLAGTISCFQSGGLPYVGYWVSREFWGLGVATRALELLLREVTVRPVYAQAATGNRASMRVLEKCGFVVRSVRISPADERYLECEEALLVLE